MFSVKGEKKASRFVCVCVFDSVGARVCVAHCLNRIDSEIIFAELICISLSAIVLWPLNCFLLLILKAH